MRPAEIADQYGDLDLKQQRKPEQARYRELQAAVQTAAVEVKPENPCAVSGSRWILLLFLRQMERKIVNMPALHQWISAARGLAKCLERCRVTFSSMDSLDTPAEKLAARVTCERIGDGSVTAVARISVGAA